MVCTGCGREIADRLVLREVWQSKRSGLTYRCGRCGQMMTVGFRAVGQADGHQEGDASVSTMEAAYQAAYWQGRIDALDRQLDLALALAASSRRQRGGSFEKTDQSG